MARKFNKLSDGKWEHFMNCVKAQFTATWKVSELNKRKNFTCNQRCHCTICPKYCPVDQWYEEEKVKILKGRTRDEALKELFRLGTEEAQALYDKLNLKIPHITYIRYGDIVYGDKKVINK